MPVAVQHCSRSKAPYPFIAVLITLGVGAGIGRVIPNIPPGNLTLALILLTALAPFLLIGCSIAVGCRGHGLSQYWIWIFFAFWAIGFSAAGATYKDDSNNWILVIYYFIFYSVCLIDYMVMRGGCYWKRDRKCLAKGCANLSIAMYFGLFGAMMVAGMYGASIRNRNFSSHFAYDVSVNDLANTREKYGWTFRDGAVIYSQLNGTIRSLIDSSNQNVNKILFEYTCIAPVTADAQAADAGNTIAFWVVMRRNFTGQPQSGAVAVCNSLDLSLWSTPHLGALKVSSYNATTGLQLLSEYAPMLGTTTLINDTLYTWTQDVEGRGVSTNTAFAIVGTIMSVLVFIAAINTICWFDTSLLVQDIPLDDALGLKRPVPAAAAAAVEEGAGTTTDTSPATSPDAAPAAAAPGAGTAPTAATASDIKPGDAAKAAKEKEANGVAPPAPASKFIHKIPATGKTAPAASPSAASTPAPAAVAAPPRLTDGATAESDSSDVEGEKPPSYEDADGPPPSINDIRGKADAAPATVESSVAPAISLLVLLPNGSKRLFTESLPSMAAVKAEMNTRFELGTTDFILEHYTEEFDEWVEIGHVRELPSRGRFRIRLGASGISGASASTTTIATATTTSITTATTDATESVPTARRSDPAATTSDGSRHTDAKKEERPAVALRPKAAVVTLSEGTDDTGPDKALQVNDDMLLTQPRANTKRKEKEKGKGDDMSDSTHTDDGRV